MARNKDRPLMVYLPSVLYLLVQEGILSPDLSASKYVRNLVFEDLKLRGLVTPEIMDSLVTGNPLKVA